MKGIYLGSYKAYHPKWDIVYQDINGLRDMGGDMLEVDLNHYDFIIATPPCNYYSKLNRFRETAAYSQKTKHLLPDIIKILNDQGKPFIVENVRSHIINDLIKSQTYFKGYIYQHGRHTYWTNIPFNPKNIKQTTDFKNEHSRKDYTKEEFLKVSSAKSIAKNKQGGRNVHDVIEYWLDVVKETINGGNYDNK